MEFHRHFLNEVWSLWFVFLVWFVDWAIEVGQCRRYGDEETMGSTLYFPFHEAHFPYWHVDIVTSISQTFNGTSLVCAILSYYPLILIFHVLIPYWLKRYEMQYTLCLSSNRNTNKYSFSSCQVRSDIWISFAFHLIRWSVH